MAKKQQKLPLTPRRFKERLVNLDEQKQKLCKRAQDELGTFYTFLAGGEAHRLADSDIPYVELWAEVHWTEEAAERIRRDEFRYISPEFDLDYTDVGTGDRIGAALLAIGLVTRPFLKGMARVEDPDEDNVSHVQVFATGEWFHPWYGRFTVLPGHLQEMIDNLSAVFGSVRDESPHPLTEMVVDYNHQSLFGSPDESKAAGWVRGQLLYLAGERQASEPHPDLSTTPSQGAIIMKETRIREILQLGDDVEITDAHRDQALDALDARLVEKPAQQATEPGTVQLSEADHARLQEQAAAGEEALRKLKERDADDAVRSAFEAGQITAAQQDWARQYALNDPQGFAAFVEAAPRVIEEGRDGSNEEDLREDAEQIRAFIAEKTRSGMDLAEAQKQAQKKFGAAAFAEYRKSR